VFTNFLSYNIFHYTFFNKNNLLINMNKLGRSNKYIIFNLILSLIITALIFLTVASGATNDPPTSDDLQYIVMGYNIQKYGTFSMDESDIYDLEPTAYREPGYPSYLALCMKLHPALSSMSLDELLEDGLRNLRQLQIPLIIITAFLAMYVAYKFTRNWLLAYIVLFLTGFSEVMAIISNHLLSENLAAVFILLCSIFLYKTYETKKIVYFVLMGISLAILTLIKAIFMYLIGILVIILIILLFKYAKENKRKFIAGIILFVMSYSLIVGGWMFRNNTHFNQWTITNKGGIVLYYRSKLDTMTAKEFMASFIYWLPGEQIRESLMERFFSEEDYIRLDKSVENEAGFRYDAREDLHALTDSYIKQGYGDQEANLYADRDLRKIAIRDILTNPFRHILISVPVAWFGLWVETGYKLILINKNILFMEFRSVLFIPLIIFACFFASTIWAIARKKWGIILFMVTPLYLYLMNILVTFGKDRYNFPLIPILNISVILTVFFVISKIKEKNSLKADKEP
jgi:4-amino-4-deoxy-L-arabinose transferase-like glycosyltransferase